MRTRASRHALVACALSLLAAGTSEAGGLKGSNAKIPITTSSEQARQLYLEGRDLAEKLRITDARKVYEQAVAADRSLAMGYVGLANTSPTTSEFFEAVQKAMALADKVSEGERLLIQGLDAGARGEPGRQKDLYSRLVKAYPDDERAHTVLGIFHFGQQDYRSAIASLKRATAINPEFSQPLNYLGYAHRFTENYKESEKAFKKYIELIPDDPNPYDSYAELLMKIGQFEKSIESYEKALAVDPNFVAS
jgi:tetratricopeptide (TPR) repeat protein